MVNDTSFEQKKTTVDFQKLKMKFKHKASKSVQLNDLFPISYDQSTPSLPQPPFPAPQKKLSIRKGLIHNKQLKASKNLYFQNEEIGMIDTQNTSMNESFEREGAGTDQQLPNKIFSNTTPKI